MLGAHKDGDLVLAGPVHGENHLGHVDVVGVGPAQLDGRRDLRAAVHHFYQDVVTVGYRVWTAVSLIKLDEKKETGLNVN